MVAGNRRLARRRRDPYDWDKIGTNSGSGRGIMVSAGRQRGGGCPRAETIFHGGIMQKPNVPGGAAVGAIGAVAADVGATGPGVAATTGLS